jgi:hypothetical protein
MPVNSDKPDRWKEDVARSVDTYNSWFIRFAPKTYRHARGIATKEVKSALDLTGNLTDITPHTLKKYPSILPILRMATAPPIARDRLVGLAQVSPHLVKSMEIAGRIPSHMPTVDVELKKVGEMILRLVDRDIFPWLENRKKPKPKDVVRASTIIADRLCGSAADPIIRNKQEERQLSVIARWLRKKNYTQMQGKDRVRFDDMKPGTFAFRLNVTVNLNNETKIKIPIDVAVMPKLSKPGDLPILIEAKSAGDFTNTNKRRKEEAIKVAQLRNNYGDKIVFVLFLCGYFDSGYLGYEAAEGIDWVWEHRIDDLAKLGL